MGLVSIVPVDLQQLTQSLRDPAVFNQHVKTNNSLKSGGIAALIGGLILLGYNAFSVFRTLSEYNLPFTFGNIWDLLWSTDGANAKSTAYLYLAVYGAPILIVTGIVLLVIASRNKDSHAAGQHQRFLSGGYVARQEMIGLKYSETNERGAKKDLVVLTHPAQDQAQYQQMVAYLRQRVADKEEGKRVAKAMARKHGAPTPLSELMPDAPAQNFVAAAVKSDPVVVMPPKSPGGNPEILATSN